MEVSITFKFHVKSKIENQKQKILESNINFITSVKSFYKIIFFFPFYIKAKN